MRGFVFPPLMFLLLAGCAPQPGTVPLLASPSQTSMAPASTQTPERPALPSGTAIPGAPARPSAVASVDLSGLSTDGSPTPALGSAVELEHLGLLARGRARLSDVPLIDQPNYTSCGEAAFAMAWNYLHPGTAFEVGAVEAAGLRLGIYFPARFPGPHGYLGTSPAGMQALGSYFAFLYTATPPTVGTLDLDRGDAFAQLEAKGLIFRELAAGWPVIVEATDILGRPSKLVNDSHYVLLIGMNFDTGQVTFNDPYIFLSTSGVYSGRNRSASWDELWASWSRNRDILPGTNVHAGRGWYMVVH
jgi:hypothetical protein